MRTEAQLLLRLEVYGVYEYIYWEGRGYMAWHLSTGENIEILFVEIHPSLRGQGLTSQLFAEFCQRAKLNPPYNSVFAFTRADNEIAHRMYLRFGFYLKRIPNLYKHLDAYLAVVNFQKLCEKLGVA